MPSRIKEDISGISEYSKFRGCKHLSYPNNCCQTSADSPLAIKANCILTLFIVSFANRLGAQTLLVGMQSLV